MAFTTGLIVIYAKPPAVNLDQVRNGPASSPYIPIEWQNGNLNAQHSHYVEGYSVPYRAVMTDLPTDGTVITLTIGYDIKDQGKHALDYLTHYDYIDDPTHLTTFGHTQETIDPLLGITGVSATTTTYTVPTPSSTGSPVTNQPTNSFTALPSGKNLLTLFGGTISNVAYVDQGDLTLAHDEARVSITFTGDSSTAVLAWGGHIASRDDWGFDGSEARSAGEINGSPYHMRLIDCTLNNLGNQDRSLKIVESTEQTGTIIIEKQTDPDGETDSFEFTSNTLGSFSLQDDETETFDGLDPGTYDVSEIVPSGWTLTSATADDGSPLNALDLSAGEVITVTFTNTKKGTIIVEKQTLPDGDSTSFTFTGDATGIIKDGEQIVVDNLQPGTYTSTETVPSGWTLTGISLDDGDSTYDLPSGTVTFELAAGETVKAIFTNTKEEVTEPTKITITKETNPGDSTVFDFLDHESTSFTLRDYTTEGDVWDRELEPGTYTFEELVEPGWVLDSINILGDDDSGSVIDLANRKVTIDLDEGEWIDLWFTNTKTSTIIVEKQTIPEGHVQDFDFTGLGGFTLKDNEIQTITGLLPGEYTVTEIIPPGWELKDVTVDDLNSVADKSNNKVTFHIEAGETVTAVFTNEKEDEPWKAKIKVRKVDSDDEPVEGWMISLVQIDKYTNLDGYVVFNVDEPGTYSILEETRSGWIPMGSTLVDITVTEEKTYEYTFKNQKVPSFVVPEYPLGTILSLITMFSVLVISQNKHKITL